MTRKVIFYSLFNYRKWAVFTYPFVFCQLFRFSDHNKWSSRQHTCMFKHIAKSRLKVCYTLRFRKTLTERRSLRAIKTFVNLAIVYVHGLDASQGIDCEQSLSFPSVFLAFLRAIVELWSSEQRAASGEAARYAGSPPRFFP